MLGHPVGRIVLKMAHLLAPTSYQIIHRLHTSQPSLLLLPYIFWVESLENVGQKGLQFTFSTTYIQKKMDYLLSNRYRRRKVSPLSPLFGKGHTIPALFVQLLLIRIFQPCNFLLSFLETRASHRLSKWTERARARSESPCFLRVRFLLAIVKKLKYTYQEEGFLWPTYKAKKPAIIFCLSFVWQLAPIEFWKFLERSLMGQTGNISSNNVSHFLLLILQLPRPGNNTLPFQHPKGSIQLGRGGGKEAKKGSSFFTFVSSAFFFMCILSKPLYFLW